MYLLDEAIKNIKDKLCKHKEFNIIKIPDSQNEIRHCIKCNKFSLKHNGIGCQTNAYKYDTFIRNLSPNQKLVLDEYLKSMKEETTNDNSDQN